MSTASSIDKLELPNGLRNFKGLACQGNGLAGIIRHNSLIGQTNAISSIVTYTPGNTGTYRIIANVNVTAWATPASFALDVTYTDDNGTSQTTIMTVSQGSNGATAAAITAVDRWYSVPILIRAQALGAITVLTAGTFTGTPVYNTVATIEWIA